ncbi:hypothetical protein BAE44_0009170 [Dichanthelium oligosanthes]|uniref:RING-type E3 ubiquitin transferase n=1 Tax=Dichanthelium oligosanthes TaxID=888268 RepID=A0A1E5VXF6_9POAL|nr:hypothetical protein BAE44_0009170 [Dichanthelium oligosanthes]
MSSGSTIMHPAASSGAGGDDDDVECRACYGAVVASVSLLIFCVVTATSGVIKASAATCSAMVFFGVIGWLVPDGAFTRWSRARAARRADDAAGASALQRAGCACRPVGAATVDVPPSFTYECAADAEDSGKPGDSTPCAVCLGDVQRGETVRRLPACGHLFHKECVDMWLHSHTACPLCRCDLLPRTRSAKAVAAGAAQSSSGDVLPPVYLRRRRPPPSPRVDDGSLTCYGIVVATALLLLFTILAATVSVVKACALAGAVAVVFGAAGCASRACADGGAAAAPALPTMATPARARAACGLVDAAIDALPAFVYARPGPGVAGGGDGSSKAGRRALCPVCLEDVEAGEMVRQLPACGHLFHVECIDMWLHSHATCPLCRCRVSPRQVGGKLTAAADPPDDAPPV